MAAVRLLVVLVLTAAGLLACSVQPKQADLRESAGFAGVDEAAAAQEDEIRKARFIARLLTEYRRFDKLDRKGREQMLRQAKAAYQKRNDGDTRLRYALLASRDHPGQALALLSSGRDSGGAAGGLAALLTHGLQRRQSLDQARQALIEQLRLAERQVAKLQSQIEALKLIERNMYEQEDGFVPDGR